MRWILKPLDDSNDLVLICDRHETALAAVHIDTFLDFEQGPVYQALDRGETVEVEVRMVEVEKREASDAD